MSKNNWHYDTISRYLHWIIALFIITMLCVGLYMVSIADQPESRVYFNLHKSFGLLFGALVLLRVIWRIKHNPAPLPTSVPQWQTKLAHLMHFLLYACIIVMPLTGFFGSSFGKHDIVFFGLPLPRWVTPNPDLTKLFFDIHVVVAWTLIVLISLHALAAFKHLIVDKDGVFQRMWW